MPYCKMYNPMMELKTVRARERVCTDGIPVANRPTKTRRATPLSARVRRETRGGYKRGKKVRGEERTTYHSVKDRQD